MSSIIESKDVSSKRKMFNVFLDLDNTIINSLEPEEIENLGVKSQKRLKLFQSEPLDDDYVVFLRPKLQKFLDFLFKNFNVSVWTAGSKAYMTFIVDKIILIKPERKLDLVLNDVHCDYATKNLGCIKNLSYLWKVAQLPGYYEWNTFLIDDLEEIYLNDKKHVMRAKSFEVLENDSENDRFLMTAQRRLKRILKKGESAKKKLSRKK